MARGRKKKISSLGRVSIPNDIMLEAGLLVGDNIDIWSSNDTVVIAKTVKPTELSVLIDRLKTSIKTSKNIKNRLALLDKVIELEGLVYEQSGGEI